MPQRQEPQLPHDEPPPQGDPLYPPEIYSDLLRKAGYFLYTISAEGIVISAQPMSGALMRRPVIEWIGKRFSHFVHPDDVPGAVEKFGRVFGGDRGAPIEVRVLDGDGRYRIGEFTIIVRRPEGRPVEVMGLVRDVTERVGTERALRESEARYNDLVENSSTVIVRIDMAGRITSFNGYAEKIFGLNASEVIGRGVVGTIFPRSPQAEQSLDKMMRALADNPGPFSFHESESVRGDGSRVWVAWFNRILTDENGNPSEILAVGRDVTERVRAEQALRESQANYRAIFDMLNDAILVHDVETGMAVDANLRAYQMCGYDPGSLEFFNLQMAAGGEPPYTAANALGLIGRAASGEPQLFEWNAKCSSGALLSVEVSLKAAEILGKKRVIAVVRDITERKRLEAQVLQSQKMDAVGRLAGGVAHDFNNMLAVILGYSDLALSRMDESNPLCADLKEIRRAGERAGALTRQLLAFGRRQLLEPRVLYINSVIADVEKLLRRVIPENIEIFTSLGEGLGAVKADQGQLEQVIMNLAVNARDAMPDGGRLLIETKNADLDATFSGNDGAFQPGPYVCMAVSDTGVGLDADARSHLFEPFFTTKEPGKGTGLGLATVYGIVRQSGGQISVYSAPGRGATFKVYLPRIDCPAPAVDAPRRAAAGKGTETILLVEDQETVRGLVRRVLERDGYRVLEADGPPAALRISAGYDAAIDMALTDVVMPEMSGGELAARITAARPSIKTLYMSGYTDATVTRDPSLGTSAAFIQKPFTTAALTRKIREVLEA